MKTWEEEEQRPSFVTVRAVLVVSTREDAGGAAKLRPATYADIAKALGCTEEQVLLLAGRPVTVCAPRPVYIGTFEWACNQALDGRRLRRKHWMDPGFRMERLGIYVVLTCRGIISPIQDCDREATDWVVVEP